MEILMALVPIFGSNMTIKGCIFDNLFSWNSSPVVKFYTVNSIIDLIDLIDLID